MNDNPSPISKIKAELAKNLVGQDNLVHALLCGLLTGGHILLEGNPGLGKTLAVKSLAQVVGGSFSRIQFTPDLLPSEVTGCLIYRPEKQDYELKIGPVNANLVLADEINRAPAKVQSALLEAMQERQVTIAGQAYPLPSPFLVVATQNPIEHSGTFPLPEAQKDRFLIQANIGYPSMEEEIQILDKAGTQDETTLNTIVQCDQIIQLKKQVADTHIDNRLKQYIVDIVAATRSQNELVDVGASPRASLALQATAKANAFLNQRSFVITEDIRTSAPLVLSHRIVPSFEADARKISGGDIIELILAETKAP